MSESRKASVGRPCTECTRGRWPDRVTVDVERFRAKDDRELRLGKSGENGPIIVFLGENRPSVRARSVRNDDDVLNA